MQATGASDKGASHPGQTGANQGVCGQGSEARPICMGARMGGLQVVCSLHHRHPMYKNGRPSAGKSQRKIWLPGSQQGLQASSQVMCLL